MSAIRPYQDLGEQHCLVSTVGALRPFLPGASASTSSIVTRWFYAGLVLPVTIAQHLGLSRLVGRTRRRATCAKPEPGSTTLDKLKNLHTEVLTGSPNPFLIPSLSAAASIRRWRSFSRFRASPP